MQVDKEVLSYGTAKTFLKAYTERHPRVIPRGIALKNKAVDGENAEKNPPDIPHSPLRNVNNTIGTTVSYPFNDLCIECE